MTSAEHPAETWCAFCASRVATTHPYIVPSDAGGPSMLLRLCPEHAADGMYESAECDGCGAIATADHECVLCECGARVERSRATEHDYVSGTYYLCDDCGPDQMTTAERHPARPT